jgi:8-oxo-dGTP pyrophosphatase MutT (NUDIX family)
MPHIHREAGQHDATSSAYIVLEQPETEPRIVLHVHKKLHIWMQFGGHVELTETPWQAMAHESIEESGYSLAELKLLQPHVRLDALDGATSHPLPVNENTHLIDTHDGTPQPHYHTDRAYAFVAESMPKRPPGEGESKDIKAMTIGEVRAIETGMIPESTRQIALFVLEKVLPTYDQVNPSQYEL